MKKIFFVLITLCFFTLATNAQPGNNKEHRERVEAMRVSYITEKLDLTVEEAQQFWPLYNEYEKKRKALHRERRDNTKPIEEMSDDEINAFLYKMLDSEEKDLLLKREYLEKMKKVLPLQKVAKLMQVEKRFKAELMKRLKEEKRGGRRD